MADLAMKTSVSGATKAAVRTIEPLTVYATFLSKVHDVHVSSTDVEVTNGDRTWDTHLARRLGRQSKRIEKPINPFAPV